MGEQRNRRDGPILSQRNVRLQRGSGAREKVDGNGCKMEGKGREGYAPGDSLYRPCMPFGGKLE